MFEKRGFAPSVQELTRIPESLTAMSDRQRRTQKGMRLRPDWVVNKLKASFSRKR